MLIDLLSTSNYISFNIKLAEVIGLKEAIYVSELMNINEKAIRKGKTDNLGFVLCRDYMKSRTTLDEEEQLQIEDKLSKIGVLDKPTEDNPNIVLHINSLTTILMVPDEELIDDIKDIINKSKKKPRTKKEVVIDNLKKCITATNAELIEAYADWIDAVCARQGWMSKQSVIAGQKLVDTYAHHDLDIALGVIRIAAINGYRDMDWAVEKYEKQVTHSVRFNKSTSNQPSKPTLSDEVF